MIAAPIPSHESARLAALHRYQILDTSSEAAFDELARLAAYVCRTPIAVISLVDSSRQWFKSVIGLPCTESPRSMAFCAHTILGRDPFIVEEADADERFQDHPWVIAPPAVRFYAGVPLLTDDGHAIGSLAVMDVVPRTLTPEQRAAMQTLAKQVIAQCELRGRRSARSRDEPDLLPDARQAAPSADRGERNVELDAQRWKQVFEQAEFGLAYGDIETGVMLAVNPTFARQRGYDVHELIGRPITMIYGPEERLAMAARFPVIDQAGHLVYESVHLRKDGTTFPVLMQVTVIKDAEGRPISRVAYAQDITERKQAEEALRMSRMRLHQALYASSTGLWEWNTVTGEVCFSREWKSQLGYDESELPDSFETWVSRLHPEDRDRAILYAQRYRDNPAGAFRQDFRLRHKDGSYRWIDSHASFVTEADGRRIRLLGSHTDITERKETEEALRESEERFNYAIEATNDGVWDWNIVTGTVYFSPQWIRLLGYLPEEVMPSTDFFFSLLHPEDVVRTTAVLQEHLDGHTPVKELELRLRQKSGVYRWYLDRGKVVARSLDGSPLRMVGTIADITERRQVEEERARALNNLQTIMETVPDVIFALDLDGRLSKWNLRMEVVTGYAPIELSGKPALEMVPVDEAERTAAAIREAFEAGYAELEGHLLTKDGRMIPYHWTGAPFTDLQGRIIGITGVGRDITARKQFEEALRQSEERYRRYFDLGLIGMAVTSLDKGWVQVNDRLCEIFGYTQDELKTKTWTEITDPDDVAPDVAQFNRVLAGEINGYALDKRFLHKDGHIIYASISTRAVRRADGSIDHFVALVQDITARKATEQLLSGEKRILELIGANIPLPDILTEVCRMIEEVVPGVRCSVLLLDEEGGHLHHGAAPSLPESYVRAIDGMAIGSSCGSCGTAAFTGHQVVVEDIASHPFWVEFRDLALPHGLRSCWSAPILTASGQVLGTFAIYNGPIGGVFDELPVVERASHLACLAIERKQTEQALRLTQFSIQHAVDAVFWIDAQARILDVNHAACTILGYTREELLSKTVHDIDPNFPPEAWPAHWDDLKARRSFSFETDHRKKDGTMIRTETIVNYLIHEGREFNCAFMRDITERKRAEARLHLTQFALERAGDMVFWVAPSSRLLLVNAAACERLGYSKEELLGMAVSDIDTNYQREDWARHWEELRRTGRLRFETQHRSKSGDVFPVEVVANFLVFDGKEYNFATVRDISDRKRTEGLLKSSEERFRLVAEATNDILWDWDLVTQDHWWSPNAREKFGYDPNAERSVAAWTDRLHPDDRDRVLEVLNRARTSDARTVSAEYRFRLADGSYGYFYDRGQIIRDVSGQACRIIGAMIDVTFSKRAYATLEEAYQRLQGMSRELQTVETNERRRLSRELHDEVGQLLTALKFDLEASRQALSGRTAAEAGRAFERTVRALETTDELFVRLRRVVRALRPSVLEELGLKDALEAMVSDIQSRSDLVCSVSVEGEAVENPAMPAIEAALYRMAQELVTNVVRHAQAMTLSVALNMDSGQWLLTVQDDGVGFNPNAESISGMGIRGVRERAEILGGHVDISSVPGGGTMITVWIPIQARTLLGDGSDGM